MRPPLPSRRSLSAQESPEHKLLSRARGLWTRRSPRLQHTNSGYPQFNLMSINQSLDQHSGNYWVPAWAPLIDERKIHHWAPLAAYTICRFHLEVVAAFDSHAVPQVRGPAHADRTTQAAPRQVLIYARPQWSLRTLASFSSSPLSAEPPPSPIWSLRTPSSIRLPPLSTDV